MKFRNVPAIITLLAGFVASVVMILRGYDLFEFLLILITIFVVFFIAGLLMRFLLNLVFRESKKDAGEEDEEKSDEDIDADSDNEGEETEEQAKNK